MGEWSAARLGRTLPPGKTQYPFLQEAGWAPRAGLDRCGKSCRYRDSIPDRPARSTVAIPTELPGPRLFIYVHIYITDERLVPSRLGGFHGDTFSDLKIVRSRPRIICILHIILDLVVTNLDLFKVRK